MSSLQIVEGLIGTACAIACLYYARQGSLATHPQTSLQTAVPWHSALGEYARRNPFAAVFGALALGFLLSSWGMYISPRGMALPAPRAIEKWHVVTKNVPTPDPAQTAKLATLQTTVNADQAMIASQKAEIDRLTHLLGKPAIPGNYAKRSRRTAMDNAEASAAPAAAKPDTIAPGATTAELNMHSNAPATNAGALTSPPPAQSNPGNTSNGQSVAAPDNTATTKPNPPNPVNPVPH